ncbi:MAG: hypothetical protein NTW46_03915, partial [Candidatus Nealsonbacteria bacterium]|nr:hypothetical protein [Candidatus Nealsonbacteria bacterium]
LSMKEGNVKFDTLLKDFGEEVNSGNLRVISNFSIFGERAITYERVIPGHPRVETYIDSSKGTVQLVIYGKNDISDNSEYKDLKEFHDKMLSTFKFTK